jgi:hypothetical protein
MSMTTIGWEGEQRAMRWLFDPDTNRTRKPNTWQR